MRESGPFSPLVAPAAGNLPRWATICVPLLVAATASILLVRTPYSASALTDYPDEVEYALGAHRLVNEGRYEIVLQGQHLPPRYPPWFSALFVAPAYLVFGSDPGVAIFPMTALAIGGVVLATAIGAQVSGPWGGALAGLGVGLLPIYWYWGRHVMTDVPCTALILGASLIHLRHGALPDWKSCLAGGVLIGLAALLRPPSAACVLPFLWQIWFAPRESIPAAGAGLARDSEQTVQTGAALRNQLAHTALILTPTGVAAAATMFYNARTFGSPFRSGYHFWCSVPYDYRPLTFSLRYLRRNVLILQEGEVPWIVGALAAVMTARLAVRYLSRFKIPAAPHEWRLVQFLFLGTGPLVLFHLVYFFPEARLQLPAIVLLVILTGAAAGPLLRLPLPLLLIALPALLFGVSFWRLRNTEFPPLRRLIVDEIRQQTAPGAVIICATDPVYLEYMINRGFTPPDISAEDFWNDTTHRRVLPLSRGIDYADKLLTPVRIPHPNPAPAHWTEHRCAGLVAAGVRDAVPWVAQEQIDRLSDLIAGGVPVYLETATLTASDGPVIDEFRKRFDLTVRSAYLTELLIRNKRSP